MLSFRRFVNMYYAHYLYKVIPITFIRLYLLPSQGYTYYLHKVMPITFIRLYLSPLYPILPQIFLTPESLSWHEVLEVGGVEYHSFVAPSGHILLPFGNSVIWICRVAVWLGVGIHGSAFMVFAKSLQSLPPIMQSMVTFPEVVLASYHGV